MKAPTKKDPYFALVSIPQHRNELLCLCSASHLEELNPPVATHSSRQEDTWCSHQVLLNRVTGHPTCLQTHSVGSLPTTANSGWFWVYEVNNVYQRSPALTLMYNTAQKKMEFTFKIKALCSYICTEDTAGEENARYIHKERHCTPCMNKKVSNT